MLNKLIDNWVWFGFTWLLIIPLDIKFICEGKITLGIILILMQIPYTILFLRKRLN